MDAQTLLIFGGMVFVASIIHGVSGFAFGVGGPLMAAFFFEAKPMSI